MSFATIVMAGAILVGLLFLLVLGLVGMALLVLPLQVLQRRRKQLSRGQPAHTARPTSPEVRALTAPVSPPKAVDRPDFVNSDGVIDLYAAGILH